MTSPLVPPNHEKLVNRCEVCGGDAFCRETRANADGSRRRRYHCNGCGERWSTLEVRSMPRVRIVAVPVDNVRTMREQMLSLLSTLSSVAVFHDPADADEQSAPTEAA